MSDEPKKPLYSRDGLKPDTPLFEEPPPAPPQEPTQEEIGRNMAILEGYGCRIIRLDSGLALTTPVEPNERMVRAMAALRMSLPVLVLKIEGSMELYYPVLEKGWLIAWDKGGWRSVEQAIRNNITLMA